MKSGSSSNSCTEVGFISESGSGEPDGETVTAEDPTAHGRALSTKRGGSVLYEVFVCLCIAVMATLVEVRWVRSCP